MVSDDSPSRFSRYLVCKSSIRLSIGWVTVLGRIQYLNLQCNELRYVTFYLIRGNSKYLVVFSGR